MTVSFGRSFTRCSRTWQRWWRAKVCWWGLRSKLLSGAEGCSLHRTVPCSRCYSSVGEMIDRIEFSVEKSHNYVKEAANQVTKAREYQSKARHVSCFTRLSAFTRLPACLFNLIWRCVENDLLYCCHDYYHRDCGGFAGNVRGNSSSSSALLL